MELIGIRFAMSRVRSGLAAFRASRSTVWRLLRLEATVGNSPWFHLLAAALCWFGEILPTWVPEGIN